MGDEVTIDLTNATTDLFDEVPVWAENEPRSIEELFSEESYSKALRLVDRQRVEKINDHLFHVEGSELYVVHVIDNPYGGVPWTTCSCPNGTNRASRPTCYHSAAVLLTLRSGTGEGDRAPSESQSE